MQIILPGRKMKKRRTAYAAVALFSAAIGAGAFAAFGPKRPVVESPAAVPFDKKDPESARFEERLEKLENELRGHADSLLLAEESADRDGWMKIVKEAAAKHREADDVWREWLKHDGARRGIADGVMDSLTAVDWINRFTDDDKFAMLAAEHGVTPETVKALKAEIEVVFENEYLEKFGSRSSEEAPPR